MTILQIMYWVVFFGWIFIAIHSHSLIYLAFASFHLFLLLMKYPVFKAEVKNDSDARLD